MNKDAVLDSCALAVVHNSAVAFDDVVRDSYGVDRSVAWTVAACAAMAVVLVDFESCVSSVSTP